MFNEKKSIAVAEKIVNTIQFWKTPEIIGKRSIRLKMRSGYKTARALFYGFFDKIRETSAVDYFNNDVMILSKVITNPDKEVIKKAMDTIQKYGFFLSVNPIDENKCRVTMYPSKIYSDYLSGMYLNPDKVDQNEYLNKMNTLFE
jgi:hypothetical protein